MWEKPRVDGKRKLKDDAEPTIFYSLKKNPERFILNCRSTYENNCDLVYIKNKIIIRHYKGLLTFNKIIMHYCADFLYHELRNDT